MRNSLKVVTNYQDEQMIEMLSEIEAVASVTHCSLDAKPNIKHIMVMLEMIINKTRAAKALMA